MTSSHKSPGPTNGPSDEAERRVVRCASWRTIVTNEVADRVLLELEKRSKAAKKPVPDMDPTKFAVFMLALLILVCLLATPVVLAFGLSSIASSCA
jgi:hypothetical protein